ncbi:MAG: N-acetylmuramoyl-L-alanine amidase [Candidatus Xenobiia bacterium LiM19]
MPRRFITLALLCLMTAIYTQAASAANDITPVNVNCVVSQETLKLDGYRKQDGTLYLVASQENLGNLCVYMGGIISGSDNQNLFTVSKDGTTLTASAAEVSEQNDTTMVVRDKQKTALLIKMQTLTDTLKGKIVYDKSRDLYYLIPIISRINLDEGSDGLTMTLTASSNIRYSSKMAQSPERLIVDIDDVCLDRSLKLPDNPCLAKATIEEIKSKPGSVRLTVPSDNDTKAEIGSRILPQCVVVKLQPREVSVTGTISSTGPVLRNISVDDGRESVRVSLEFSSPFSYQWRRLKAPDNRFFVDFSSTTLEAPDSSFELQQNLLVKKIRAAQLQPGPDGTTRLVMDFTHPAVCEVRTFPENPRIMTIIVKNQLIDPDSALFCGNGSTEECSYSSNGQGRTVCIDPGHGGSDRGAYNGSYGIAEKDVTLEISRRLGALLRQKGWRVVFTRVSDRDVTYAGSPDKDELGARTQAAHCSNADLFVSIHINASVNKQANGVSTHWYKNIDQNLAQEIQFQLIQKTGRKDRGTPRDRFYVLRTAEMPSVLVEAGFISNDEEAGLLLNEEYLQRIVQGIADGMGIYISKTMQRNVGSRRGVSSKK